MSEIKYNLGCGYEILEGYINCDINEFPGVDVRCPLWRLRDTNYQLLKDNSIDEIRASHVIEHVPMDQLDATFEEWARVLKPGGILKVYCPNAAKISNAYLRDQIDMTEMSRLLFGEHDFSGNVHSSCFDDARLSSYFESHGFEIIGRQPREDAYDYDLGIQGQRKKK